MFTKWDFYCGYGKERVDNHKHMLSIYLILRQIEKQRKAMTKSEDPDQREAFREGTKDFLDSLKVLMESN